MRVQPFAYPRPAKGLDHRDMLCISLRGSIGRGTGFGRFRFAATSFGDRRAVAGIYQKRRLSNRRDRYDQTTNPEYPIVAMRSYRPTYTNTEIQAENRAKFAAAVAFWQGLTAEDKALYDKRAVRKQMSGYNVAISDFIRYYDEAP